MAKSCPKIAAVTNYLRSQFPKQENLDLTGVMNENLSRVVFTYSEVKAALLKFKTVDPDLHRLLGYHWQTSRSRNDIAEALNYDSSTIRRRWIKGINIVLNYLINEEVTAELEPIDILYIEAKKNGTLANA